MRNYVLNPYQIVKDLRTGHESGNPQAVFDGDLDDFLEAGIRWRRGAEKAAARLTRSATSPGGCRGLPPTAEWGPTALGKDPMEPIDPVYGTATLLLIAAGAVALLLVLIMELKLHAFVVAGAGQRRDGGRRRLRLAEIPDVAALRLRRHHRLGRPAGRVRRDARAAAGGDRRRPGAGRHPDRPVRREAGAVRARRGGPDLRLPDLLRRRPGGLPADHPDGGPALRRLAALYALPAAGAFAAMHAIVPPHPGPVAAARAARRRHRPDAAHRRPGRRRSPGTSASTWSRKFLGASGSTCPWPTWSSARPRTTHDDEADDGSAQPAALLRHGAGAAAASRWC